MWRLVVQLNLCRSVRTILDAISDVRRTQIDSPNEDSSDDGMGLPPDLEALRMRLLPLRQVESFLIAKLVPASDEQPALYSRQFLGDQPDMDGHSRDKEIFVRPGTSWKGKLLRSNKSTGSGGSTSSTSTLSQSRDEPQEVLHSLRQDIMQLWGDRFVRDILRRRKIRLEEFPGL